MATSNNNTAPIIKKPYLALFLILIVIGFGTFILGLLGEHPGRAWQAYLINFLLWSAIAQGALLFSAIMHTTKARWSGPLSNLAESFAAFFPISFILFFLLIIGKEHVFPWLHQDLHGKEGWLNLPFLISRNTLGLFILYGIGFAYLYYALQLKLKNTPPQGKFHQFMHKLWDRKGLDDQQCKNRKSVFSVLYISSFS